MQLVLRGLAPTRPGRLWIGASAARGIRRAAAMADAWLAPPLTPPGQLTRDLATYRGACATARRPPARQLPIRRDMLICGPREEDRRLAQRYVSRRLATYASWGLPGPAGVPRPAGPAAGPAVGEPAAGPPAQTPPDRGGAAQIVGTAAECRAQLSALQRAVGRPALVIVRVAWPGMTQPGVLGQIRLAGEELIPAMIKECDDE
jgi:alkanesulfonate monooxygenase SsuD/methylene tetrahydromethanopterin reductase-like flavin-dependent oxidoreductase (luciferase family)